MTTSIRASDNQFLSCMMIRAAPFSLSCYLLNSWTPLNLRGSGIVGICAELSAIIARFAVRFFTDDAKILRGSVPLARFVGGHYLGNMALTALRFHPLTFGASTVAIMLPFFICQMLIKSSAGNPEMRRLERDALL